MFQAPHNPLDYPTQSLKQPYEQVCSHASRETGSKRSQSQQVWRTYTMSAKVAPKAPPPDKLQNLINPYRTQLGNLSAGTIILEGFFKVLGYSFVKTAKFIIYNLHLVKVADMVIVFGEVYCHQPWLTELPAFSRFPISTSFSFSFSLSSHSVLLPPFPHPPHELACYSWTDLCLCAILLPNSHIAILLPTVLE